MATFKPIAINRTGVNLPFNEGQFIVATQPFTDGGTNYPIGVYVDMKDGRKQLTMQGPKGDTGDTGATGATGQNGQAATISIGQVMNGAPGGAAVVSNSGTPQNAIFNFVIPTGETGSRGEQGASLFHTMAASGTSVAVSSLQPQIPPLVGDAVVFSNGDIRQITAVGSSTVTLGDVLFSFKGDPGIGNANLSNIDGDSTEEGFTQAAVKGVAQAKNYYNLSTYDTYVSNGDETGTTERMAGRQYYTGKEVIVVTYGTYDNLDYFQIPKPTDYIGYGAYNNIDFKVNKFIIGSVGLTSVDNIGHIFGTAADKWFWVGFAKGTSLEDAQKAIAGLVIEYKRADEYHYEEKVINNEPIRTLNQEQEFMLRNILEGKNGQIVYGNSNFYLTTDTTSPASILGGSWESLGGFTVGSNTIYLWRSVQE